MTDFETIVIALVEANKKWPELRFTQILQVLNINTKGSTNGLGDNFHHTDKKILKDIKESLTELQN